MSIGLPISTYFPDLHRVHDGRGGSHIEPPLDDAASMLTQLRWHAAVVQADSGIDLDLRVEPFTDRETGTTPDNCVLLGTSRAARRFCGITEARDYLNGIRDGVALYRAALARLNEVDAGS